MSHPTNTARKVILKTVFIIIFIDLLPFVKRRASASEEIDDPFPWWKLSYDRMKLYVLTPSKQFIGAVNCNG
jgi:hypothetical protein